MLKTLVGDSEKILRAIRTSEKYHKGQKRKASGAPYVTHPIIGSYILMFFKKSKSLTDLICAFILHDTLEDTDLTFALIQKDFGPRVASLVLEVTNDVEQVKALGKNEYLKSKMLGISSWALVLKLVDRLSNILDNPKPQYVCDTIGLMNHLKKNRKLSKTQKALVKEILLHCYLSPEQILKMKVE